MQINKTQETILDLKSHGYSKYKMAKELNVSWQTIHMWHKGMFVPAKDKMDKLINLLEQCNIKKTALN